MNKKLPWVLGFIILYGLHAIFYLTFTGRLALPLTAEIARGAAIATLVGLTLLVTAFIATRDEVMRRIAMLAAGASMIAMAFISYGIVAFDITAPLIVTHLWAFALLIYLLAYGVLSWQARS